MKSKTTVIFWIIFGHVFGHCNPLIHYTQLYTTICVETDTQPLFLAHWKVDVLIPYWNPISYLALVNSYESWNL